jgi:hypothetical protein
MMPATLGLHQPTGNTLLHERIQSRGGGICSRDASPRDKGTLYSGLRLDRGPEDSRAHLKTAAMEEPAAGHLNCDQTPAYIRGPGPLD